MADSTHLQLPYIAANQAQKHVTHNEGIRLLDGLVQLAVLDRDLTTPPGSPADGSRYLVASGATGAWDDWDGNIAYYVDGAWMKLVPHPGWLCWVADEELLLVRGPSGWGALTTGAGYSLKGITRLYSGTSIVIDASVTAALIRGVGGGGGGGGAQGGATGGAAGGGGAGGAFFEALKTGIGGATLTYAIGAAGAAGSTAGGNGGTGGTTSISNGTWTLQAQGGVGGNGQTTGNWAQAVAGGYGQNATGGDLNIGGEAGSGGIRLDAQNVLAGRGAGSRFGAGGNAYAGNAAGQQGLGQGAGGGGGSVAANATGRAGGAGAAGYIEIWEFVGGA